jgi:uncharacterized protein (DUF924 family)
MTQPDLEASAVLEFWFGLGPYDGQRYAARSHAWFQADPAFDQEIRDRFAEPIEAAARGAFAAWEASAQGSLSLIVLLDQFPRNAFRGSARAYAYDSSALRLCEAGLAAGFDRQLSSIERQFFYLPLQHAEDASAQRRCVALFERLADDADPASWLEPALRQALAIARAHAGIIERYGRYPHRNTVLGRKDTWTERMYLDAGGPRFGQEPVGPGPKPATRARCAPEFRIYRPALPLDETVCADGRVSGLRCVSHWPGAAVAAELQHPLSTGMALAYARLPHQDRLRVLGSFSIVTNDHYDTDGVLTAFGLLRPEAVLAHSDLMLRAAASGDLRRYEGADALALDLSVSALDSAQGSPLAAELAGETDEDARSERCYRWLLEHLPALLKDPFALRSLWHERFARVIDDLRAVERRTAVHIEHLPALDLAVVSSRRPLTRFGLVHAAAESSRVLQVMHGADGFRYRFLYRNESWFLGMRDRLPPRRPLEPARVRLAELERAADGAWWCTSLDQTSPQLGFGSAQRVAGVFGDLRLELDPPSRLAPARVVDALHAALAADGGGSTFQSVSSLEAP